MRPGRSSNPRRNRRPGTGTPGVTVDCANCGDPIDNPERDGRRTRHGLVCTRCGDPDA